MPLDYSKWKAIEVSDDEDDTHPNIDTPSLFRWRHQARLERMAEKKLKKEQLEKEKSSTNNKLKDLEDRLASAKISEEEKVKMQKEIDDLKEQDNKYRAKEAELAAQEKLEPWNVDTIGTEGFSKSRINKVSEPKPAQKLSDEDDGRAMAAFCETNESLLQTYAHLKGLKASEKFLIDHPFLACEYTANYLTIECLNCAIDMKDETMCQMAEQCIVMQYLLELAKSLKAVATNENVIRNFFRKFAAADPSYMKAFHEEVTGFQDRLRKRAQDKRDAAYAEFEQEEKKKRIEQSPGGLDPQEVFEELPEEMQKCFESQDIQGLKDLATKLDEEVFAYHFQRCIDSGLWVPEKPQDESSNNEGETETESVKTEDLFE